MTLGMPTSTSAMSTTTGADDATSSGPAATLGGDGTGDDGSGSGTTAADDTAGGIVAMCPPQGAMNCAPGPGRDACDKIQSCFAGQIATAVSATIMENPDWFQEVPEGTMVLDVDGYVNTVVDKMTAAGRCAIRDPNDGAGWEVAVKHDNAFAESFRLIRSDGTARTGTGSYTATCVPAWF
jgi:hypothetical protein